MAECRTWTCPAFTDDSFLGLMVSDMISSVPPPTLERGNERPGRSEQAGEALRASAVSVGLWLSWHKEKKQQKLWMDMLRAQVKAVDARVARIEELLELVGRATPLRFAYDAPVVRLLLGQGEDPNARDETGHTPLHWAAGRYRQEVVRLLLEADANPDARAEDGDTRLAHFVCPERRTLKDASWPDNLLAMRLLLEAGGDMARGGGTERP